MRISDVAIACVVAGTIVAAAPAARANNVLTQTGTTIFSQCDGYGMPSSGGDGMTKYATIWGIFNPPGYGTTARSSAEMGAAGITACDAALADEHLKPEYWMRKVNLLRARALHRLQRDDVEGALTDLALAKAAIQVPDDPFFARSLGLGLDFVQAYALRKHKEDARSAEIATKAWEVRAYSRGTTLGALVALGYDSTLPEAEKLKQALARFQPSTLDLIYRDLLEGRRWTEVVALYPQLRPPKTRKTVRYGASSYDYFLVDTYSGGMFRLTRGGSYAFALAALGRGPEAEAVIEEARALLEKTMVEPAFPAPQASGKPARKSEVDAYYAESSARVRLRRDGPETLETWAKLVRQRILVSEGKTQEALASLSTDRLSPDPLSVELVDALLAKLPAANKDDAEALKDLRNRLQVRKRTPADDGVHVLFEYLPEAEVPERLPVYKAAGKTIFGNINGFSVTPVESLTKETGAEVISISFRSQVAPSAIVEEMAMLRAAELARQAGKSGFVILDRGDTSHTSVSTYYGMPLRSDPNGYDTSLSVTFVDLAALPAIYSGTPWRVIDANAVYEALAPIYIRPEVKRRRK